MLYVLHFIFQPLSGALHHGSGSRLTTGLSALSTGGSLSHSHIPASANRSLLTSSRAESASVGVSLRSHLLTTSHVSVGRNVRDSSRKKKKGNVEDKKQKGRKRARPKDTAQLPEYNLGKIVSDEPQIKIPMFTPPDLDRGLLAGAKLHDVNGLKVFQQHLHVYYCGF